MIELVSDSLRGLGLAAGLTERVMAALPSRDEMKPALHPALRVAFGVTATFFAAGAWWMDLPTRFGAGELGGRVMLAAIFLQAAVGAVAAGITLVRDAGPAAVSQLAAAFRSLVTVDGVDGEGAEASARARPLLATVGGIAVVGACWLFLGYFPSGTAWAEALASGLRAARASAAAVTLLLVAAAAVQVSIMARGREWRAALRLVEAGVLILAGVACAANYVIFVA